MSSSDVPEGERSEYEKQVGMMKVKVKNYVDELDQFINLKVEAELKGKKW